MENYLNAAYKLHTYIVNKHWNGQAIVGPDPIGKINWRVTRFIKSYTPWLPWNDQLAYLQAQSYWIVNNCYLTDLSQDTSYLNAVERCADYIVQKQLPNGVWEHPPIRERRGFISTVESVWACLGLVAAYRKLSKSVYLHAVLQGYDGLLNVIKLRRFRDSLCVNYHSHTTALVPNVTTMFLQLIAEIYQLTGKQEYLNQAEEMVRFVRYSQMENGELQYIYDYRPHFQCYQYNSFEFLDLVRYYQLTNDEHVWPILARMSTYLATGLTERGSARYNCFKETPEVNYWIGALATALHQAHLLQLGDFLTLSERAFDYLLLQQRADNSFGYSKHNYIFLRDECSYPRYLAMILNTLLYRVEAEAQSLLLVNEQVSLTK